MSRTITTPTADRRTAAQLADRRTPVRRTGTRSAVIAAALAEYADDAK